LQRQLKTVLENANKGFVSGHMMLGTSPAPNAPPAQLKLHEILLQAGGLLISAEEGSVAEGATLRLMSQGDARGMELDVQNQMKWTEAYLQERPGFGNRLAEDGRGETRTTVRGGLMFACSGRGSRFFGRPNVDSEAFQGAFPSATGPTRGLAGFFCNGEIGPTHLGSTETKLHGFTSVYTLFEGV